MGFLSYIGRWVMLQSLRRDGLVLSRGSLIDPRIRIVELRGRIWRYLNVRVGPRLKSRCWGSLMRMRAKSGVQIESLRSKGKGLVVGSLHGAVIMGAIIWVL